MTGLAGHTWRAESITCRHCGVGYARGARWRPAWCVYVLYGKRLSDVRMYRLSRRAWRAPVGYVVVTDGWR